MRNIRKIALFALGDSGWQGGIQYITNIVHALNEVGKEQSLEVHIFKWPTQYFSDLNLFTNCNLSVHDIDETFEPFTLPNRIFWFAQRKLTNREIPRYENYFIKHGFDFVYPGILSNCGKKLNIASWIADFQYHHFPEGADRQTIVQASAIMKKITTHADKIVLSSRYCERDCHRLFPVSKGKTHVMPFAVFINKDLLVFSDFDSIREKYSLPDRFLFVANLFAPTKNHKTLFDALGILKAEGVNVNVVCTGNIVDYRNLSFANDILQMITWNKIRERVLFLGLIPRPDQVAMFRMAAAVVQPSVSEGWSTSVEEAKALGKNLILSDIDVHREQDPGNPYLFESMSANDMAKKIKAVWENSSGPFPDLVKERKAMDSYNKVVKAFGRNFLEIAAK